MAEGPAGSGTGTGTAAGTGASTGVKPASTRQQIPTGGSGELRSPSVRPGPVRRGRQWWSLAALLVVLVVALAIGSGAATGGRQTRAQRAATIDSQVRCPSCADLSVAQSSASAAVAVREEVTHLVALGRTNSQIESTLVGQYGPTILLRPPTSGLISLVWFLPALGAVVTFAVLAVYFRRRSRAMALLRREAR